MNKTINNNTEENIKRITNNKNKYNQNDQDSIQSTNRYASRNIPTTIQWTSSDDLSTSVVILLSFQKRKTIINKVDQFLKRFKLKKRKSSKSQNRIQTRVTINERINNSRVNKLRTRFSIPKTKNATDNNNLQNGVEIENTNNKENSDKLNPFTTPTSSQTSTLSQVYHQPNKNHKLI